LDAAAEAVLRGGVIAFPTDTLYGLGCSLFDVRAVEMVRGSSAAISRWR
jgi:tRNA A37 threonylcarbamoyladenosine synthetase subunit TsaC/SUA5/YrdC